MLLPILLSHVRRHFIVSFGGIIQRNAAKACDFHRISSLPRRQSIILTDLSDNAAVDCSPALCGAFFLLALFEQLDQVFFMF